MLQQLVGRCATSNVDAETHGQEGLELLAKFLGFLQARRTVRGNEIKCLQRLFVEVGRLRLDHFNRHDTKRPNVDLWAVFLLFDNLRCHPIRRSNHGGSLRFGFGEFGTETEISCAALVADTCWTQKILLTDLDVAASIEEDIVTLDVTMDDVLLMQMLKASTCLKWY